MFTDIVCRSYFVVILTSITLLLSGCPTGVQEELPYANSPDGSVPAGSKAYSPDGQYYAMEIAPRGTGQIGVFDKATDSQVWSWNCLPDILWANDLKGIAWSSDSKRVAVMYHGGPVTGTGVYVYELSKEDMVASGSYKGIYCHYIRFSEENDLVYLMIHFGTYFIRYEVALQEVPAETDDPVEDPVGDFQKHSGANLPWINYGWDLGAQPWGGAHGGFSAKPENIDSDFKFLAESGVKMARVFLFCDLRTATVKIAGQNGSYALDFDSYVKNDMDALLAAAEANGLKLIPVLFDYTLADGVSQEGNVSVGEHPEYITKAVDRKALVDLMDKFFTAYGQQSAIYAWDVMNEPEYVTAASQAEVRSFVSEIVTSIHANTNQLATVGSRNLSDMLKWQGVELDLYQFHHYDAMGTDLAAAYPSVSTLSLDKPVIVGEIQPTRAAAKLSAIQESGYSGAFFWSLNADYSFSGIAGEYSAFFN